MAAYEHLPIFKKLMDLTVFMERIVSHFSRYHKYTLGSELRSMCHQALGMVVQANSAPGGTTRPMSGGGGGTGSPSSGMEPRPTMATKTVVAGGVGGKTSSYGHLGGVNERQVVLLELRTVLERIKIHLMVAREVQAFHNKNSFIQATELVVDLCRQNEGWIKSTARGRQGEVKSGGRQWNQVGSRGPESPSRGVRE